MLIHFHRKKDHQKYHNNNLLSCRKKTLNLQKEKLENYSQNIPNYFLNNL